MATGTNFPGSTDSWANKATGDFVTVAEFNERTSAIEQLEIYALAQSSLGMFGSLGQRSLNNNAAPTTKFDLVADTIALRSSTNQILIKHNPGTITNDVTAANSVDNGRDQAGAFSSSSWIHFYWVATSNGTLKSRSSTTAPPTGCTLQTGEIYWAYAGAVRFNASSQLIKTRIIGNHAIYEQFLSALATGTATTETSVSLTALIPPNALYAQLQTRISSDGNASSSGTDTGFFRLVTGSNYFALVIFHENSAGARGAYNSSEIKIPNISQQFLYIITRASAGGQVKMDIDVVGYTLPNGGG